MENLDKGYIKLYRSVRDNWIWDAGPYDRAHAWIDILLSASHCDTKMMFDCNLVTVKRGTYITSIRKLAVKWGWSRDKVAKFLDELQKDGMITRDSNIFRTLLTVEKYSVYQDRPATKPATKKTRTGHASDTNPAQSMNYKGIQKNYKEYKGPSDCSASADSDDDEGWMDPLETQELYERMKRNEEHV